MDAPKGRLDVAAGEETSHILSGLTAQLPDRDPEETAEWIESLDALIAEQGTERAQFIMRSLLQRAGARSVGVPMVTTTDYVNTIPVDQEAEFPGNEEFERRYRAYMRWNAAVMVHRAQRSDIGVGGHISTYAGAATLYEVGFNHFFRGKDHPSGGDQVFFQGHASPGMYARAFMEGRLSEEDLDGFRQEKSKEGHALSSYPHPRLMPGFWEFPTVSMGIGPMNAIYQAQSNRYLHNRGIKDTSDQQVWAFLGDGEMDEPESRGLLQLAANENLDNLNFVINCNLQRLDGPVRGNGKIMQELEAFFRGAGWNVIKVVWGREWDSLLEADHDGALVKLMNETADGDYQTYKAESGGFVREHFFGRTPQTKDMVADLSDEQIWNLKRGGHDYRKVYAAYKAATEFKGKPTVILAKTVKGYGLGPHFEGRNATHQMKKLTMEDLKAFRDHLRIPISDEQLDADLYRPPYYHPGMDAPEIQYLMERRKALGGFLPERRPGHTPVTLPEAKSYDIAKRGSGKQQAATTMAFVRLLKDLMRDKNFGHRLVPVVPDESRTFGMDAFFPTAKIYNPKGQNYLSVDRDLVLAYKESPAGQLIHPGINEAGAVAAFTAAGTSYATHGEPLVPIYVFYSMFGFQRTGDSFWAAADQMTRGFIIGATAGRTTLTGEGLQHADGHSPLLASTNPAVRTYDPAYGYEIGHIIRHGLEQMYGDDADADKNVMYYLTVYNEPITQPAEPADLDINGLLKGIYQLAPAPEGDPNRPTAQILASGVSVPWALEAARILNEDWGVAAAVWSVTSWNELRRDGLAAEEHAFLNPGQETPTPFITKQLHGHNGPVIAVSDYMKAIPDQIRQYIPNDFASLGADGFGFSDTRQAARRYFKNDTHSIVTKTLQLLAAKGEVAEDATEKAIAKYRLLDVNAGTTGGAGGEA
ncbi:MULTISPECIES: pyruvate dehydrogenase (acetyl-transferring), homodimeric type [Paenarthrobacter]|jgi:pyruvate dehydrogenase E1 component|uniref:Pyruvate dehydrogenase E1 component n=3 Tax=Paenarthrobacter ureafaciens TaxID=37931 RepID=A0AAX3ER52_PAEUR|nr:MULTISPECIES: pyruvate dehydrogenase (acetyl-transferring), homodimeric type [Paenarthrobacter]MDO5864965.1 pyruvate dehydrogenase (acetyl-transferring), homodimeric type [Paenarthrobacter sp. SD-2]MDO5876041.1 pyruvate dehydrogenase (acetyl-transferring), homodimeric type [Paenarthrobacter sp. SD-1]UYV95240.1 pyruvate dehydrogenase (acetyl-transferring), homodimeric type [Paenarthrobacter ureafaciens]UYV99774.1 pyruvate dehydrogenase (acetyl-transferring), homodimeric type [Paenarthrobacter